MSKATRRMIKFGILAFTVLMITQMATTSVDSIVDFDRPRTIQPGYDTAFTHTVQNYKSQRFTVTVSFNETVPFGYTLHVICLPRAIWDEMLVGTTTLENMTGYLFYEELERGVVLEYSVVLPDWEDWTFVFLSLNAGDMLTQIRLEHQHVLWWLWIVIPSLVVIGLVAYGVVENVTKYERARMDNNKAISKLSSRTEGERKRAAYWLISNGTHAELVILDSKMDDEKPVVRENAAFAIGGISKRLGDKSLSKSLEARYEYETDRIVKEKIVGALSDIGDVSSLKILEKYLLNDNNEQLRFKIALSLKKLAEPKSVKTLLKVIQSENTDTLKIACNEALENIASKENTSIEALKKQYSE